MKKEIKNVDYNEMKKNEDADTIILDQQGYFHDGHYCKHCMACPYISTDIKGLPACYYDDYLECCFS